MKTQILQGMVKYNVNEIGIDEVGRGCLFGPVYIAGVILPDNIDDIKESEILKDSKLLSKKNRDLALKFIENHALEYHIVSIENKQIDEINILNATLKGMHDVVDKFSLKSKHLLVDGNNFLKYPGIEHTCVIKGDNKYKNIAAASILAKTARDKYIEELTNKYKILNEKYNLEQNKGYGTSQHINGIKIHGITNYHRLSFKPCKDYIETIINIEDSSS